MHLFKLFKVLQITAYALIVLGCLCGPGIVAAQAADITMVKLNVREINEKVNGFGCAPNAAVNVFGSWATGLGKDLFPTSANLSDPSATDIQGILTSLSSHMGTAASGRTSALTLSSGIRQTLKDYEVDGRVSSSFCTWRRAKREIDAGRPFIAGVSINKGSIYYQHYVCVIGYVIYNDEKDNDKKYSLLFHDGYGEGETEFYPTDEAREQSWFSGPWDSYWQNPWIMVTIKLKEHPCDASSSLDFTVPEPEINIQSGGTYCDADTTVKNTSLQTIRMAYYSDFSERWVCLSSLGFCQATEPGEEFRFGGFASHIDTSEVCTENHQNRYIALKDTDECKDMFNEIRSTGVLPEGIIVKEAGPAVCECP